MKNTFLVATVKNEQGKLFSYTFTAYKEYNLLKIIEEMKFENMEYVNIFICSTRKEAEQIAHQKNQSYRENGTYAF